MSNYVLSDETVKLIDKMSEIADHIKELTDRKKILQKQILKNVGFDTDAPIGTTKFTDEDGSERLKITVAEELVADDAALFADLKNLQKLGLLHTVVKPTFKIDKRALESLPADLSVNIKDSVTYKSKSPAITIM